MLLELADITYPLLSLATWGYSIELERRRRNKRTTYAPHLTWATVVVGCSIVLAFAAARIALGVPILAAPFAAWWAWAVVLVHFGFGGGPIIWWQLSANHKDDMEALEEARRLVAEE